VRFYTYIHKKKDTGAVFYVGKGSDKRAFDYVARNIYWKRIAKKHRVISEIVKEFDDEHSAFEHEKYLIEFYKNKKTKLANFTMGGEGVVGYKHTTAALKRLSELAKRQKHSIERKKKLSERIKGKNHPFWGKYGSLSPNYKGSIVAVNKLSQERIKLNGKKHIQSLGWRYDKVLKCVNGQKKTYKGFEFSRETKKLQPMK
jgi:NUMOD3 motif